MKTEIFFSLKVFALHRWTDCNLDEVSFLKEMHRHEFHIKGYTNVTHSNRDIEFIVLKNKVNSYMHSSYYDSEFKCLNFGDMSCEQIAQNLLTEFNLTRCEVSEDNENGAVVSL